MRSSQNIPATIAIALRAAVETLRETTMSITLSKTPGHRRAGQAFDSILAAAEQLDALAAVETTGAMLGASDAQIAEAKAALVGEGPSDGEMLEWVVENLIEKCRVIDGVVVRWVDSDFEDRSTKGKDTRDAITKAMAEQAAVTT